MKQMFAALFTVALFLSLHLLSSLAYNDGLHLEEKWVVIEDDYAVQVDKFIRDLNNELTIEATEREALRKLTNKSQWFDGGKWQVESDYDHKAHWDLIKEADFDEEKFQRLMKERGIDFRKRKD